MLVHAAVAVFLLLVGFSLPAKVEEGGMSVMLGEVPDVWRAGGLSQVEVVSGQAVPEVQEQELITQEEEETVAVRPKDEARKKTEKPVKTETAKAEEVRRQAEAKAKRERREAEEAARKRVAGAFGKGARMGNKGNAAGKGAQGSPAGTATSGAASGAGGYGTVSLGERSLGEGGLPKPVYNVQDEGTVVVDITVNPDGRVIATGINRQTNTVNPALRKAATDAAAKARFNAVGGVDNQTGTITYYFNLK